MIPPTDLEGSPARPRRVLDPMDRIGEVLFGLIMALTFTGAIRVAEGGREEVRTLLIGALGCNLAWGIVDAVMYLMACLAERATEVRDAKAFLAAEGAPAQRRILEDMLPATVAECLDPSDLDRIRASVSSHLRTPPRPGLRGEDWNGAFRVFLLVTVTTFPVVIPFLFIENARRALFFSNGIAIAMLFACGWAFAKLAGGRPWLTGLAMVLVGILLVLVTMALGG